MTPTQYLRALARFWWIVVVCVLLGGVLALALGGALAPPYTSTSRVLVSTAKSSSTSSSDAYYGTLLAQQRVLSYAELARGPAVASQVIEDLDLNTTSHDLTARIRVVVPANSTVLDISVDDASATQAQRIAGDAANVVADQIDAQESDRAHGSPLLRARAVGEASSPTPSTVRRNTWWGIFGGLVVGLLLAVAAARLDRRLHDGDAVKEATGREALGELLRETPPARLPTLRARPARSRDEAIRELRTALFFRHPLPDHALVVSITSVEPLDDLPEVASELAAALADTDARVLLVEADLREPRQGALLGLPREHGVGLATLLDGTRGEHDVFRHRGEHRFDVIPAGSTDADPAALLHARAFADFVNDAAGHYDFVLLLAPALSVGTDALAVGARSDVALVCVARGRTRAPGLRLALDQLERAGAGDTGTVLVG